MSASPERVRGVVLVGAGVLLLSPDSLLVRVLTMSDATVLFYRGACALVGYLLLLRLRRGALRARDLRTIGRAGLVVAGLSVAGNACFVVSVRHTTAAHALLILAAAPLFTALLTWLLTRDAVPLRTWVALAFVIAGVGGIFLARPEPGQLHGDLVALAGAVVLATLLVVVRRTPGLDMVACLAVGAGLTALVAAPLAAPATLTAPDAAIAVSFGVVALPVSLTLITVGPAYLPAPEVSLLMLIETVLGPVWVWAAIGERPASQALVSGLVIVAALAGHAVAGRPRRLRPATP